jgi:hypothetical protein
MPPVALPALLPPLFPTRVALTLSIHPDENFYIIFDIPLANIAKIGETIEVENFFSRVLWFCTAEEGSAVEAIFQHEAEADVDTEGISPA